MNLYSRVAIIIGKIVSALSKIFGLGSGATWSGEIALRLNPHILHSLSTQAKHIILVAGTNGKTTTVKMIETILVNNGKKVTRNSSGANLDNGLVSTFIADMNRQMQFRSDYFIFEVDEATLPNILKQITPEIIVLNNLFRDQLDRYGEVDTIAGKWLNALKILDKKTAIIINSDDPHLAFIGLQLKTNVRYFGLEDRSLFLPKMQHATDTIYCPKCGARLTFAGVYFSHLGIWTCEKCGLTHPKVNLSARDVVSPIEGVYNIYNTLGATLVAKIIGIAKADIQKALKNFQPAFGRMEDIIYQGKNIRILLSKNPTGFNESLRTIINSKDQGPLLLLLNDRIPDGTDVSWIWDVDFELLRNERQIIISGDRCWDMGVRIKYAGIPYKGIYRNLKEAIGISLEALSKDQVLWVLATYSAMLDTREILVGRKIL